MVQTLSFEVAAERLKVLGEPTRLRLAVLLSRQDLTVSDLVQILGQSQPRISRHLKLLMEMQILRRHQEGAWAYFRLSHERDVVQLVEAACAAIGEGDPVLLRDRERLDGVRRQRAESAARYFAENAERWDRIRSLHLPDGEVEAALDEMIGQGPIGSLLDIGTGTGRMLEVLGARAERALGIDASREMLALARAKLDAAGLACASVRQGDAYRLPVDAETFDLVTMHQVLHYLDDPQAALREAARALAPGGRLAVVDFAPHDLEFLRESHAHLRLGFSCKAMGALFASVGLALADHRHLTPPESRPEQLTVLIAIGRDMRQPLSH